MQLPAIREEEERRSLIQDKEEEEDDLLIKEPMMKKKQEEEEEGGNIVEEVKVKTFPLQEIWHRFEKQEEELEMVILASLTSFELGDRILLGLLDSQQSNILLQSISSKRDSINIPIRNSPHRRDHSHHLFSQFAFCVLRWTFCIGNLFSLHGVAVGAFCK